MIKRFQPVAAIENGLSRGERARIAHRRSRVVRIVPKQGIEHKIDIPAAAPAKAFHLLKANHISVDLLEGKVHRAFASFPVSDRPWTRFFEQYDVVDIVGRDAQDLGG